MKQVHAITGDILDLSDAQAELSEADLLRVCRDLAWSEMAAMPGIRSRLGPRLSSSQAYGLPDWSPGGLALDSLARMQLATAAAVWCNANDAGFDDIFLAKRNAPDWAKAMRRARSAGASGFTFSTSGSTSKRQHIRHAQDSLMDEARCWAQVFQASSFQVNRIVTLVPCHHIYGFIWGVLMPKSLGVPVLDASHEALPELLEGDLLVAVPDQWQWLAGSARAGPALVQGGTSTAPMPKALHQRLVTAQMAAPAFLARLLQIYGSTQTGGIGWRDLPYKPYTLAPNRRQSACGGIDLLLPSGALVPLALQDELQWINENEFELLRRTDYCVQVGGHNVSTAWVTQQLLTHSAVQDASVRLDTDAPLSRLKAFVVLREPGDQPQQASLEAWVIHNLPWYANFSSIRYGAQIPRNALGKQSDWPT